MLYNIYSVRDQGWERALVVARPEDRGAPEGDFVKWLGASEVPRAMHWETLLSGTEDPRMYRSDFLRFYNLDLVQRELKKIYQDTHPLGKGTIARKVREKIHPPDLSRPKSWKYWAQRTADAVLAEMKRRGLNIKNLLNRRNFEEAMLELWCI